MENLMEIITWDGGLHLHEIEALNVMKRAFVARLPDSNDKKNKRNRHNSGDSLASQLGKAMGKGGMFPWKGYAGFRFVDSKGNEGEFDLLLITHERVLIIELKELRGKKVTANGDKWYCDGTEKYRSPVSVTHNKVHLLKDKLYKIQHKFKDDKVPWIDFMVVLSNNNNYSALPDQEKKHVMTLSEFVKLADESRFRERFGVRGHNHILNTQFPVFDKLISGNNVKPKHLSVQNYITTNEDQIFPLSGQDCVYKEFIATSLANKDDKALLRQWDFDNIGDQESGTPEGRYHIISHERDVLVEIKNHAPNLYRYCLQPKTNPTREEVTRQFHELYDLPADHKRFNEYINQCVESFDKTERVTLVQVLLQQFADLHMANIAHRDIGDHSIWLSPSKKVSLSSFISSYFQPVGTVGPRRKKLSVGVIPLPEDKPGNRSFQATPFHRDVYALGIICQLILSGERLTKKGIRDALSSISQSEEWYGDTLRKAVSEDPTDRFKSAVEFRNAITKEKPASEAFVLHNEAQLDRYRSNFNPYQVYKVKNSISDVGTKEVYESEDHIVRLWSNANPGIDQPIVFQACLDFFDKANKLSSLNSHYLAGITEFGISLRTSQLYLVQENVAGTELTKWMLTGPAPEEIKEVIDQLIRAVEYLHNAETYHGDLHPSNVIISHDDDNITVRFIDFLDFRRSGERVKNHRYSPHNIDTAGEELCDNFAVMRMSAEMLGIDWDALDDHSDDYAHFVAALKSEQCGIGAYLSLERIKQALEDDFSESSETATVNVVIRSEQYGMFSSILPDNEELYLHIEAAKRPGQVKLRISGIGGRINFFYSPQDNSVIGSTQHYEEDNVTTWEKDSSQFVVDAKLYIRTNASSDYQELNGFLATIEGFQEAALQIIQESEKERALKNKVDDTSINRVPIKDSHSVATTQTDTVASQTPSGRAILSLGKSSTPPAETPRKAKPRAHQIWRTMIETEVDALPTVTLTANPEFSQSNGLTSLQYSTEDNFMDKFSLDDEVELLRKVDDKLFGCGKLHIKASTEKNLYVKPASEKTKFSIDDVLHLRTNSERSSFTRRKKAVDRILNRTSIVADLIDYFGDCSADKAIHFSNKPTDEDFAVYDRKDGHGGVISLNELQRKAFTRLVTTGPVSLLQGPPGTGKTEFIAAFTHYLISKEGAKHILLVSQSHEAVNTAAERIRQHCDIHKTELDVVRFSNKPSNVSPGMINAYSVYLVERCLSEFKGQFAERLFAVKDALGLPLEYLEAVADLELGLSKKLRVLKQLLADIDSTEKDDLDRNRLIEASQNIRMQVVKLCAEKYNVTINRESPEQILALVNQRLSVTHGIAPNETKRVSLMMSLMNDFEERLDTSPGSYEEFLARSRTLVCGTCVGIGLGHLSVKDNQYDWVIIDEAARSSSSELAIAMQSGKRVLLVGDHKQLPPTYQNSHKRELSRRLKLNQNDADFEWVLKSDFERAFDSAYGKVAGAKLLIQYRMAEPIGNMVSDLFYNSELKTGERHIPDIYNCLSGPLSATVNWLDVSSLGDRAKSQEDDSHSCFNTGEVEQIISVLKQLHNNTEFVNDLLRVTGENPGIGVICMYSAQKRLLFRKFNENQWSDKFKELVKIDTVDSYQGKENRIIIVSTTLNSGDMNPRFLRTLNRINVAMSRAMDRLLIVGSTKMWKGRNSEHPLGQVASYMLKHQGPDYRFEKAQHLTYKGRKNAGR